MPNHNHNRIYRMTTPIVSAVSGQTSAESFRWYLGNSNIQLWHEHLCTLIVADSHVPAVLISPTPPTHS